jgi:hypothetical protein
MNYKHTVEAAIANLGEIENLLQGFKELDPVPSIEIDLALQKARNLYEILLLLKQTRININVPPLHSTVGANAHETAQDHRQKNQKSSVTKEKPAESKEEKTIAIEQTDIPVETKNEGIGTLQDSLTGQTLLHESFHQNIKYQDLSSRIQAKPIADIAAAIGINERFLYIRELFNNDTRKYEKAVQVLNSAANFNDAYNYMIREFTWDMDSELVQELLEIVRRKFITRLHE